MTKVYGYARVSTEHQSLTMQIEALRKAGIPEENIFSEKYSGKELKDREQINMLLNLVEEGDIIIVKKLDRLGRSVSQITSLIDKLYKRGIYVKSLDDNVDTSNNSPMAKAMMQLLAMFAEMERNLILDRTQPAIERAKKNGVKFGAPKKSKKEYEMAVDMYLQGGKSVPEVLSKFTDLTEATFYRRLKQKRAELGIL